ncbi:MAG: class I SAM-dependent methyltransferase [archaeon]
MNTDEKIAVGIYDNLAQSYHDLRTKDCPHGWFYNEFLEMPTMLELLGRIKGKKILDFGCGSGIYAEILTKKGAKVKGFDISKQMLAIAKQKNPELDLRHGSGYKIPFKEKFDIVISSLVVHYLNDWNKMLKEIKRVLKRGGLFILSTGNPVTEIADTMKVKDKKYKVVGDYFKERTISANWENVKCADGKIKTVKIRSHHITYETLLNTLIKNGFEIMQYKDCKPSTKSKRYFPEEYEKYTKYPLVLAIKTKLK